MLRNRGLIVLLLTAAFSLSACVVAPPRERVVYRDGYQQPNDGICHQCGAVQGIDQVRIDQPTTGGGAILGAIIGGVIGNQFGHGGGRAAMTGVGVVGGAAAGNAIEQNNAQLGSGYAWRYYVQLDDGRTATVTQRDNPGYRIGDRVMVRGGHGDGHLEWLRQ